MTTRYVLQVTLLEDLHTGTGTGGGGIDSVQAIDREGRPVIRGTHVRGVLREAANEYVRLAAKTLPDEHDKQIELRDQVIRLFGSESSRDDSPAGRNAPSRGALFVGSLRLKPSKDGTGDGFILWSSTARGRIERTTGDEPNSVRQEPLDRIPLEDTLRTVEFIPAGKCFEGEVSLLDERLKPLLDVCVKRVQCLGSSRTRGAGLVRMTLQPQPPGRCHIMAPSRDKGQTTLRLLLTNHEPLCLPITGFPGNIVRSECYIRGQALLGALCGWALEKGVDASPFLNRRVSVGNAWPLPYGVWDNLSSTGVGESDVLPIPLHVGTPKPKPDSPCHVSLFWPWWASHSRDWSFMGDRKERDRFKERADTYPEAKRPKDTEFLFRASESDTWIRYAPQMGVHMRNQTPPRRGSTKEGELFSEEEIAEGTCFVAELSFYHEDDIPGFVAAFAPILDGTEWLSLGRGGRPARILQAAWLHGPRTRAKLELPGETFTLTLESDLILRSAQLTWYDDLNDSAIEALTGLQGLSEKVSRSLSDTVTVRGFNAASGLPRSPVLAIRRGSTFIISCNGSRALWDYLARAHEQKKWLGERTWEGFGRFRLNFDPFRAGTEKGHREEPSGEQEALSFFVGKREKILEETRGLAEDLSNKGPSTSEWQYLRTHALAARSVEGLEELLHYLTDRSEKTKSGEKAWKAVIGKIKTKVDPWLKDKDKDSAIMFIDTLVRWILAENPKAQRD